MVPLYNGYTLDGVYADGTTSLHKNIADNGGLKIAYYAYQSSKNETSRETLLPSLNFTSDQLFFISYGMVSY